MTEHVVVGHSLTRAQAARRAGVSKDEVVHRPDLLRLPGRWLEETYFAFQFDGFGVRPDVGRVVRELRDGFTSREIADWLGRPNRVLDGYTPLRWLASGQGLEPVLAAARAAGPVPDDAPPDELPPPAGASPAARVSGPARRVRPGFSFG